MNKRLDAHGSAGSPYRHIMGRLTHRHIKPFLLMGALLTLPFNGVLAADAQEEQTRHGGLVSATPESQGVDSRQLVALSQWLREEDYDVRSLLIVKDNKLVFERYTRNLTRDHNYELYSVTKTITALLAGILIEEGRIGLDDSIAEVIADYRPDLAASVADKDDITLHHVLSMSSGLAYDFDPEGDPIYYGAPDRLKLIADTGRRFPPGSEFEYTDVNPVFAAAMLSAAAGMPIQEYAEEKLFKPLNMKNYAWVREDEKGLVSAGWGLRLRPIDMAKLGVLIMQKGEWQGEQIVPSEWIERMSTPQAARDFGYYLWLNHIVDTEKSLTMMGFKGQFVTTLPERDTVVVMTSLLPIEGGLRHAKNVRIFRNIVNDYVIPATAEDAETSANDATRDALREELERSRNSRSEPGVFVDPTDEPRL
ncbi:CubicO group peptidase, beta-lactamase class C family [Modicisalibacter muralis]|uniref:CubicO group peptidase, beta-lactamase class C family n=1 Tax=Modicisalibacter muralis TaxID=119000 RepID=A0A1G9GZ78_9GAMM|nr:serine hydrolase [Halomonas muralis]SDL05905.1 CubicO group peptidase, beta-lactamase class C family [Halomonas muralis]